MSVSLSKFCCPVAGCQKQFSSIYNLERHKDSVHLQLKSFKCQLCGRHLSSKQNLNEHLLIHTGEKPYRCDKPNCGEAFRQRCQLLNHKKIHLELLKFIQSNGNSEEKNTICNKPDSVLCDDDDQSKILPFELKQIVDYLDSAFLKDGKLYLPPLKLD